VSHMTGVGADGQERAICLDTFLSSRFPSLSDYGCSFIGKLSLKNRDNQADICRRSRLNTVIRCSSELR
jgi:hypothetical protein